MYLITCLKLDNRNIYHHLQFIIKPLLKENGFLRHVLDNYQLSQWYLVSFVRRKHKYLGSNVYEPENIETNSMSNLLKKLLLEMCYVPSKGLSKT